MVVTARQLVGRETELGTIVHLLELPDRLPAIFAVVGDAGIGKTTLSLAAAEAARARGYLVLSCRPAETEVRFSFAGLADLIGGVVADVLPQLPPPQRRALEGALALSESDGKPANEGVVAFSILSVFRRLAAGSPLLLVVDDVQWLDGPSLAMLRFALSRLDKEPVGAVVTARGKVPSWIPEAVPQERLQTIELGPLSVGALREMLRTRLGAVLPRPTLLRIWQTSGGNPFFALELTTALQRRGGRMDPGEELAIPATLQELVHHRFEHLGIHGLEVARLVAMLANPTMHVLEAAAGSRAPAGVSAALEAGILELDGDRLRFAHPLLRSAAASRAGPAERRSLHSRLAEVVQDNEERAWHLALATAQPSREVAAVVEQAANSLMARGGSAAAAELAELAVRLTPPADVGDMRRRVLDCADRYRAAGDGSRAISLLEHAYRAEPPGATRAVILVHLAGAINDFVSAPEAAQRYREALIEAVGDDALVALIHLRLADLVKVIDEENLGLEHAAIAIQAASRVADDALRCSALAAYAHLHFRIGRGVAHREMDEALALELTLPPSLEPGPATWALVHQVVWSGDLVRGRVLLEDLVKRLHAGEHPGEEQARWYLGMLEWRAGNWPLAAGHAAELLAIREQFGFRGEQATAELPAAMIAAYSGQITEARDRSERALKLAEVEGIRVPQSGHRAVLGFIELSRGDPAAALTYLKPAWAIRDSVLLFEPGHRLELADTLESLIAVGDLDDAEQRISDWEERSRAVDRSWAMAITARCRALLLAARGDLVGAQASFERALAEHARTQDPFQHARTLLAHGATQRRARQRGAARITLDQALAIFEQVGAPIWAAKARDELRRIGGRGKSRGGLTEAEGRIAGLVAEGRTNREVAAALFVTEHTVEAALTRAYQKLGVRSRAELAARLRRES